ncbi:hypothetical protein AAVH_32514 [Aphelenchoides avenae]|nr:hypothetical protein AAVH_32514 [Aphelenchus avenae]
MPRDKPWSAYKFKHKLGRPMKTLKVGYLRRSATVGQIRATFEGYGELEDVVLVPKEQVAFVVFKHLQDAKLCANCLDGQWVDSGNKPIAWTLRRGQWEDRLGKQIASFDSDRPYCPLRIEFEGVPAEYHLLMRNPPPTTLPKRSLSPPDSTLPFDNEMNWTV